MVTDARPVETHLGPAGWFMNAWNRDAATLEAAEETWPDIVGWV